MIKKTGLHLKMVPDIPVLHQMLSQSLQKPGEKLLATWRNNETLLFSLELVCSLKEREPRWLLICEKSGRRSVLVQLNGHDILLIYKQIAAACADAQEVISKAEEASNRLAKASDSVGGGAQASNTANISAPPRTRQLAFPLIGKLQEFPLPKLLNLISAEKMTGRLQLEEDGNNAHVFLQEGRPIEAKLTDTEGELEGDLAFAEILYWTQANYNFKIGATTNTRNLVKNQEILLEHIRPLAQVLNSLTVFGMTADSAFKPSHDDMTGEQFTAKATPNAPVDMEALASLYLRLDGHSTMSDLEKVQILPRPLLVRSIEHLINCDIISIVFNPPPRVLSAREKLLAESTRSGSHNKHTQVEFSLFEAAPRPTQPTHPDVARPADSTPAQATQATQISMPQPAQISQPTQASMPRPAQISQPTQTSMPRPAQPAAQSSTQPQSSIQPHSSAQSPAAMDRQPERSGPPVKPTFKPKVIDSGAIESVMMSLRRHDTGLFIYPAFLYFLEEEFFRIYRAKGVMSVLLFEMREVVIIDGNVRRKALSPDAVADAAIRISSKKRHTDIVAHYEGYDFGIILPSTKSSGARVFVQKILKALTDLPLAGTDGKQISFAFGVASIPEDFVNINSMLGAAELAMNYARDRNQQILFYRDLFV